MLQHPRTTRISFPDALGVCMRTHSSSEQGIAQAGLVVAASVALMHRCTESDGSRSPARRRCPALPLLKASSCKVRPGLGIAPPHLQHLASPHADSEPCQRHARTLLHARMLRQTLQVPQSRGPGPGSRSIDVQRRLALPSLRQLRMSELADNTGAHMPTPLRRPLTETI